ncbi:MAG TPA: calcium-binding protein [Burkholderiales bacterium]|nr:calcium-binding protein [Burkholderiales bacterium]
MAELAQLTLIASDAAYKGRFAIRGDALRSFDDTPNYANPQPPFGLEFDLAAGQYVVDLSFEQPDDLTGFKAVAYRNTVTADVVLAFGGTDGPNSTDWWGNLYHAGWNQWEANRERVRDYLRSFITQGQISGRIHLTGQSLGGALAQYALYDLIETFEISEAEQAKLSLITFNSLGGLSALREKVEAFDSSSLKHVTRAVHYVVENDLVHRLGEGHVGGVVKAFRWRNRDAPAGTEFNRLNTVDAHRIEGAFYKYLHPAKNFFAEAVSTNPDYLAIPNLQRVASRFGNIFQKNAAQPTEALIQLVAGMGPAAALVPAAEINEFMRVLITAYRDSGTIRAAKAEILLDTDWSKLFRTLALTRPTDVVTTYSGAIVLSWFSSVFEKVSTVLTAALTKEYGPVIGPELAAQPEEVWTAQVRLLAETAAGGTPMSQAAIDKEELARRMQGPGWLKNALSYLAEALLSSVSETVTAMSLTIGALKQSSDSVLKVLRPAGTGGSYEQHIAEIIRDVAHALARAASDYLNPSNSTISLGPRPIGYERTKSLLDAFIHAYKGTGFDTVFTSGSTAQTNARGAMAYATQAAQVLAIRPGIDRNPFDSASAAVSASVVNSGSVREGQVKTFTAFIPYEAQSGGQRISLSLQGSAATGFKVLNLADEIAVNADGTFTLWIKEGDRSVTFGLWAQGDVDVDQTLALSATLVDAAGAPTHKTHLELNLAVDANAEPTTPVATLNGTINADSLSVPSASTTAHTLNGLTGNDIARGGAAHDIIDGGFDDDYLTGGAGDDRFIGGDGNDFIVLGAGTDNAQGGPGDDFLGYWGYDVLPVSMLLVGGWPFYFGTQFEWHAAIGPSATTGLVQLHEIGISSEPWADTTIGLTKGGERLPLPSYAYDPTNRDTQIVAAGIGDDVVVAGPGDDTLQGDDGNDTLLGMRGDDTIFGGIGNDIIAGNLDGDYLDGGAGDDAIDGEDGSDSLLGRSGADVLRGDVHLASAPVSNHGDDYLDGGDGVDLLAGYGGHDTLYGGEGNDTLHGDIDFLALSSHGSDYLDGEGGDDVLVGYGGDDELFGGSGRDRLLAGAGNDYADGEGEDDELIGDAGDDELFGGAGSDRLFGGAGADDLDGEDAADTLLGEDGADRLFGSDGNDALDGGAQDDSLAGGFGADTLLGQGGNDVITGGADADGLWGHDGNDTLSGGPGSDILQGGAGDDVYVLATGDGNDAIYDAEGRNRIRFADAMRPEDFSVVRGAAETDIVIAYGAPGDSLSLAGGLQASSVQQFEFADGTLLTHAQFIDRLPRVTISGTAGPDQLVSQYTHAMMDGAAGDDVLAGSARDDVLLGGTGGDSLSAGPGADVLDGGPDADALNGGPGNDVYLFGPGSGLDSVLRSTRAADEFDTVVLAAGVQPNSATLSVSALGDPILSLGIADKLTLHDWYTEPLAIDVFDAPGLYTIAEIRFADGTVWDVFDIAAKLNRATAGSDTLRGIATRDVLNGLDGGDSIEGNAGDDALSGGAGNDVIDGGFGADELVGDAGADVLSGREGPDQLDGGPGDDMLDGGPGDDAYVFGRGSGTDRVAEEFASGEINSVVFGAGVAPEDVTVTRSGDGAGLVTLGIRGTNDRLLIGDPEHAPVLGQYVFENGVIWSAADVVRHIGPISGTDADDYIFGSSGDDIIDGGKGGDVVDGGSGDDLIRAGAGFDYLIGGPGSDTYEIAADFGRPVIIDANPRHGDSALNTIRLPTGIGTADVALSRGSPANPSLSTTGFTGSDLVIATRDGSRYITVRDWFAQEDYRGTLRVVFADGATWDADAITSRVTRVPPEVEQRALWGSPAADAITGTALNENIRAAAGNDRVDGGGGDDALSGGGGDDVLFGNFGIDRLHGGPGRDTLDGGADNDSADGGADDDTYVFQRGMGRDLMIESYGPGERFDIDTVSVADGITPGEVTLSTNTVGWVLRLATGEILTIASGEAFRVVFADRTVWTPSPIPLTQGIAGKNDNLVHVPDTAIAFGHGFGTDRVVLAGYESIVLFAPDVTPEKVVVSGSILEQYSLSASALKITLTDSPTDVLYLQNWFDSARAGNGVNRFRFANGTTWNLDQIVSRMGRSGSGGADVLWGTSAADVLASGAGNDTLVGHEGNDVVDGGAGNDVLVDGEGDDRYRFSRGFGSDTIEEALFGARTAAGNDRIEFDAGIAATDVIVTADGDHLRLQVRGSGDVITIRNWVGPASRYIEQVSFAGGPTWTVGDLVLKAASITNGADAVDGSPFADVFDSGDGSDRIAGHAGDDRLAGAAGEDDLSGDAGDDTLDGGAGRDRLHGATGKDILRGGSDDDLLNGGYGDDLLDGGAGGDTMLGGPGDDRYVVDDAADVVFESAGGGLDTVDAFLSHTLAANVENLALRGSLGIDGTGNNLANTITGNDASNLLAGGAGNDTLAGGAGIDTLIGGTGNDSYIVQDLADVVTEKANEGIDFVYSPVTYAVGVNVENIVLTGSSAANAVGNTSNNVLYGNTAANVLDGAAGADTMIGGAGDDSYVVDNAVDSVIERAGDGTDRVYSAVAYSLGPDLEILLLTGSAAIAGTGNARDNVVGGNSAGNVLTGGGGNDRLDGGAGADRLIGGRGDDRFVVDNTGDVLVENANEGSDTVESAVTYALGPNLENLRLTGTAAINGFGNALNNVLTGNAAPNILRGGAGNDTYVVDSALDAIIELTAEGLDAVQSPVTYTLAANVENLTLTGSAAVNAAGNALDNVMTGNAAANLVIGDAGHDTLDGAGGVDRLVGGAGNDTYVVDAADVIVESANEGTDLVRSSVTFTLGANVEHLVLTGTSAIDGTGNALDNTLTGNATANRLNGAGGADRMAGGSGNDHYYVAEAGDVVIENSGEGTDTVFAALSYTLGAHVENLTLTGSAASGTGNALDNVIDGNAAANTLRGGAGSDILFGRTGGDRLLGGPGNDVYIVDSPLDVVTEAAAEGYDMVQSSATYALPANVERLLLSGSAAIDGTGNALDNLISGNAAANRFAGGAGNDTYVVSDTLDTVFERAAEGTDLVQSSISYTLPDNVENLNLTGTAAIGGTGNALDNVMLGNSATNTLSAAGGNDRLDGALGADVLIGGAGDDTYVVDDARDAISETAGQGIDTVTASVSLTLAANVENLTLLGSAAISGTGNALANRLAGNAAANLLNGAAGADTLIGGAGNDTYIVDNSSDRVVEQAGGGTDTIQSVVDYALSSDVEILILAGASAIAGAGNDLDNVIVTNSAANTVAGRAGHDTYVLDSAMDVVVEQPGEGTDTVRISASYVLPANIEHLVLTGSAAISGRGNALGNSIVGNTAANTLAGDAGNDALDGGAGADAMSGGSGDDTYLVDNLGDTITEGLNEGLDLVKSSVIFTLAPNVENLTLTGAAAINGTGNAAANLLVGNSAPNALIGGAGNDTLDGGAGVDRMSGGAGDDTYVVDVAGDVVDEIPNEGVDTIRTALTYTLAVNLENLVLTGSADALGTGNAADNVITGNAAANSLRGAAGNDTLNGGGGADFMLGGPGDDTYVVSEDTDTVTEQSGEGVDVVRSGVSYELPDHVEHLTLTGSAAIDAYGNALANVLAGNSGKNTLHGRGGADTMAGGAGDDTYVVDSNDDVVIEAQSAGDDHVTASTGYVLPSNVERLTLFGLGAWHAVGNDLDNVLVGNTEQNMLEGGAGNDRLEGRGNVDLMRGGAGDDVYVIEIDWKFRQYFYELGGGLAFTLREPTPLDDIVENANEGIDTVYTAVTYTLPDHVENLRMMDTVWSTWEGEMPMPTRLPGDFIPPLPRGIGNALDNVLTGGKASSELHGAAGNDTLYAGSAGDRLYGEAGNDRLHARIGDDLHGRVRDVLFGGPGDDVYFVHDGADIAEWANEGFDVAFTSSSYTMGNHLEQLTLTGSDSIDARGSDTPNVIIGNDAANLLSGGFGGPDELVGRGGNDVLQSTSGADLLSDDSGNNVLSAGGANDVLRGGSGSDFFIGGADADVIVTAAGADVIAFNRGDGRDTVAPAPGQDNTLSLGGGIRYADINLTKAGNDLLLNLGGSGDAILFDEWYAAPANRSVLNIQMIAEAMSDFDAASSDTLRNRKILSFDFGGIVGKYDAAGAPANWKLTDALLTQHLKSSSDSTAIGADLAYNYGRWGSLTLMRFDAVQAMLGSPAFGVSAQVLNAPMPPEVDSRRLF